MTTATSAIGPFVLRTFLWLPACFAAWYFSAPYHAAVAGWLAHGLVDLFAPGVVSALERQGLDIVFVTTLKVRNAAGQDGLLLPEVNPLLYTYGVALLVALLLAARGRWWTIPAGIVLLLPFQAWGIAFDFLAQVGIRLGRDVAIQAGLAGWRVQVIALAYQIGNLILPSLMPVALWASFNRDFIGKALRRRVAAQAAEAQRVLPGELRAEKEYLGRVIDP